MKTSLLSIGILTLFLMIGGNNIWGQSKNLADQIKIPDACANGACDNDKIDEGTSSSTTANSTSFFDKNKEINNCMIDGTSREECEKQYTENEEANTIFECESNPDKVRNGTLTGGSCDFKYYGGNPSRGGVKSNPQDVLQMVAGKANKDRIFDNELNKVNRLQGGYSQTFKISNTLDSIRQNIASYMQWAVFLGLSIAVLLIIYNGFLLVTNNVSDMKLEKAKSNIINILTGVAVLTGFYLIIRLVVSLLANFS